MVIRYPIPQNRPKNKILGVPLGSGAIESDDTEYHRLRPISSFVDLVKIKLDYWRCCVLLFWFSALALRSIILFSRSGNDCVGKSRLGEDVSTCCLLDVLGHQDCCRRRGSLPHGRENLGTTTGKRPKTQQGLSFVKFLFELITTCADLFMSFIKPHTKTIEQKNLRNSMIENRLINYLMYLPTGLALLQCVEYSVWYDQVYNKTIIQWR